MDGRGDNDDDVTGSVAVESGTEAPVRTTRGHPGRGAHANQASRWKRAVSSNVFLGLVLAVLAWPSSTGRLIVASGIGSSWRAAVTMASHFHLAFGSRAVFTFGPLGFLVSPQLFYASNTIVACIFTLAFMTAIFTALLWSLRHTLPLPMAALISYFVGGISLVSARYFGTNVAVEDVLALVLIVCVAGLSRPGDDPLPLWIWIGLGGVLSIFSLLKLSLGIGIAVALVITVACLPSRRWKTVGAIALGLVPVFCLGWFGTGNGFGNLVAFGRSSIDIIGGYGAAMAYDDPTRAYSYWLAAIAVVVIGWFAFTYARGMQRRARIGIGLVTLTTLWFLFKEGFVRHDSHDLVFFVATPLVLAAFAPRWRSQTWLVTGMLAMIIVIASVSGTVPGLIAQPVQSARNLFDEATTLTSGHKQAVTVSESRNGLDAHFKLPNPMVIRMRGQSVDVSPWQQTAIWAHPRFHFDPLPVLQDYAAFTPSLDHLDTSFLASSAAPKYILRQPALSIDGRNPAFDPPATQLAIECRYRQVDVSLIWQLLERQPDRCGQARLLSTVTTGLGHWVAVPSAPPGDEVVGTFQLPSGLFSTLESLIFKPPNVFVSANNGLQTWRFIAATAPEFHILRAASTLGYSAEFVPVHTRSLKFSISGEGPGTSGVKISFYEIPIRPAVSDRGISQ